jgi:hypothetical protein
MCVECNSFVRWASKKEVSEAYPDVETYLEEIENIRLKMVLYSDLSGEHSQLLLDCITKIQNERKQKESYLKWKKSK